MIHPRILKEASKVICLPLSIMFNTSILKVMPFLRTRNVTALKKKSAENYRSVSLTCIVCKIFYFGKINVLLQALGNQKIIF